MTATMSHTKHQEGTGLLVTPQDSTPTETTVCASVTQVEVGRDALVEVFTAAVTSTSIVFIGARAFDERHQVRRNTIRYDDRGLTEDR